MGVKRSGCRCALVAAWVLWGLSTSASAPAAQYFVSQIGGSDGAAGTSAAPWATLQHAANVIGPGDRVTVRAGQYTGFYLDQHHDGQADDLTINPVEFFAEPNVLITARNATTPDGINLEQASYVTIDGFAVTGMGRAGVRSVLGNFVTIRNVHAYNNTTWGIFTGFDNDLLIENNETSGSVEEHGIYVSNSGDRPTLRGNYSWGNHGSGIHMNGDVNEQPGDGIISGALITGNRIVGNAVKIGDELGGGSGINMDGVQNSRIENNLVYGNHASGISLYHDDGGGGSSGNVVVNNTVYQPNDGRWALNITDDSTGNTVRNNIFVTDHTFRGSIAIQDTSLAGTLSDYNVVTPRFTTDTGDSVLDFDEWRDTTPFEDHSLAVDAAALANLFVNPAAGNFRLKPGALGINAGTAASAPGVDFFNLPRPQGSGIDMGAIEWTANVADYNGDGQVNAADLAEWQNHYGAPPSASATRGNADGDLDVDGADFLTWQRQVGASSAGGGVVPEPAGWLLALLPMLCVLAVSRA